MDMMDVKPSEVGYREIEIENIKFDEYYRPVGWKYKVSYLTYDRANDNSPGMRFGDHWYARNEVKLFDKKE